MNDKEIILSLETSGSVCGVALSDSKGLIDIANVFEKNLHDSLLATMVRDILNKNAIKIEEISAIALSGGPGSFTGLRIGSALAKGITFRTKIKFIPVDTLTAFAYYIISDGSVKLRNKIAIIINSHKNIYYIQEFSTKFEILSEISSLELNQILSTMDSDTLLCGPGTFQIAEHLDNIFDKWDISKIKKINFNAEVIDKFARKLFNDNYSVDALSYVPNYFQDFLPKIKVQL